ncbi:hypothetical protein R3W88_019842 [Solanum pinnatisectum]|uniref:Polygalacturonase n=1 Tax=Solanum pinnatisectum TaxID=50273 RepID=A0AAV9KKF4_9SOLN|nr:hypothetical protein R3W88_019842 [Solanum pinnatisectum]
MELNIKTLFVFTLMLFLARLGAAQAPAGHSGVFDVTKFGATPNGDISKAILDAFKEACASTSPSTIIVPKGTYQMKQVKLEGPCKAPLEFQLQGTLQASPDPKILPEGEWFTVNYLNQFTLSGTGIFDGQGKAAWAQNDCAKTKCAHLPYNLSFNFLNSSTIQDITSKDSKNFHMNVNGCNNLTFNRITITAPKESINTDGIHVARSKNVNITDSVIGTGDDCISVGDELEQLHITKVTCGPGHGISVGSLGKTPGEKPVVGVYVKNCTFINTDNGVRVKTWPASHQGVVTELHYEDIIVQNVSNPIVIDQVYCPYNKCNKDLPSLVKISKVSIKNVKGTSRTQDAVLLLCSKGVPCEGVEVGDIDITYNGKEGPAKTSCENVKPTFLGKQNPPVCAGAQTA